MNGHDNTATSSPAPARSLAKVWIEATAVALVALTINLAGNGRVGLWDRDEPRYAGCAREMRASGDWLKPKFNEQPRYHKPALIYWLMNAATAAVGDNPFGARLPSAIAGTGTCLLVWALARRMFGANAARLAAAFLITAPIQVVESKLATTDAMLAFCFVACQVFLWELSRKATVWAAAGFWVALAVSTLTKGPTAPALLGAASLVSWWWGGPTDCWKRLRPKWGAVVFAAIALPWFAAIGLATRGEFFRFAYLGKQGVGRIVNGIEQHWAPPGYYLAATIAIFYPWSFLLPSALRAAWSKRRERPEFGFLLGWIVGPWIVLECVQTKLFHYFLPAYPACAILAAWMLEAVASDVIVFKRRPLGRLGVGLLAGVGLIATAGFSAGAFVFPGPLRLPCLIFAALAAGATIYALDRLQNAEPRRAVWALAAAWALILLGVGGWLAPAAEPYRISRKVARELIALSRREHAPAVLATVCQPSIIYEFGRPVPILRDRADLVARLEKQPRLVTVLLPEEIAQLSKDRRVAIELLGEIRGFNHDKMRTDTVRLAILSKGVDRSRLAIGAQQVDVK